MSLLSGGLLLLTSCSGGSIQVSANAFDFGTLATNTRAKRVVVTVSNSTSTDATLHPNLTGTLEGALSTSGSCERTLPAGSSCSIVFTFAPSSPGSELGNLALNLTGASLPANQTVTIAGQAVELSPGQSLVSSTGNPLVALYTYYPTTPGSVWVDFGTDTSYGLKTNLHPTPTTGGPVSIYVAGMRANTTYHMRASVQLTDGTVTPDTDHTFTTSNFAADELPQITVSKTGTPQPGVELMDAAYGTTSTYLQAYATDLDGNVIWGYDYPDRGADTIIQPVKLLPNGNFLVTASFASQDLVNGIPTGELVDVREIDLAGNPVRDISLDELNTRLASGGFNLTVYDIHHDVEVLPNGHWVLIASTIRNISGTDVVGDAIVDLDTDLKPVWVWNEFDHLDVNRRPTSFPDWTHTNAVLYSPDDGNLLISMRHQSWIVKVNYNNGAGNGDIIWRLGEGGDFTLTNGVDPTDWFYGQHQPAFVGTATSGVFSLAMMDNGFSRLIDSTTNCGSAANPCYTTIPILSINENAKTATFLFHDVLPASLYSSWGGGTTALANGNLEYDLCDEGNDSEIDEVKITNGTPQTVWQLKTTNTNLYRANRIPSLYPGVQW